jgi:hemerythrin-like metal-binding protein
MTVVRISLGVEEMDDDHARIDDLLDQVRVTADESLPALHAAVARELEAHFRREEAFLREKKFPGLFCHVAQHGMLLADVARAGAKRGGELRRQLESILPQLVRSHIATMDGMAAAFLKGEMPPSAFDILRLPLPEAAR